MPRSPGSTLKAIHTQFQREGQSFQDGMMYKLQVEPRIQAYTHHSTEDNWKSKREAQISPEPGKTGQVKMSLEEELCEGHFHEQTKSNIFVYSVKKLKSLLINYHASGT